MNKHNQQPVSMTPSMPRRPSPAGGSIVKKESDLHAGDSTVVHKTTVAAQNTSASNVSASCGNLNTEVTPGIISVDSVDLAGSPSASVAASGSADDSSAIDGSVVITPDRALTSDPALLKPTSNISASCGIVGGAKASSTINADLTTNEPMTADLGQAIAKSEASETSEAATAHKTAYEKCRSVRDLDGSVEDAKWNGRAVAMLPLALEFVDAYLKDPDGYLNLCAMMKAEGRRVPSKEKLKIELVSVNICMQPAQKADHQNIKQKQKADQTEWSRFANVVKAAQHENVAPDKAINWLKEHTLNQLLRKARELKAGPREKKPTLFSMLNGFENVARALKEGSGPQFDALKAKLEIIDRELENHRVTGTRDALSPEVVS